MKREREQISKSVTHSAVHGHAQTGVWDLFECFWSLSDKRKSFGSIVCGGHVSTGGSASSRYYNIY